ncbi:MAG: hypothetical protein SGI71_02765 [Verrucomicrobiota bacterium]|nr:hypothetical protein [Verrucomicrobiota bacterium]
MKKISAIIKSNGKPAFRVVALCFYPHSACLLEWTVDDKNIFDSLKLKERFKFIGAKHYHGGSSGFFNFLNVDLLKEDCSVTVQETGDYEPYDA